LGYHLPRIVMRVEGGTPAADDSIPVSFDPAQLEVLRALQQRYDAEHIGPPVKTRTERA
jgi:hypothetical protein